MKYKVKIENGGMGFEVDEKNLLKRFSKAQKVLDSEVLRRCDPYVPMDTGMLKKSGILGTVIGSGKIVYTAPYARRQYYTNKGMGRQGTRKRSSRNHKGLRGAYWFERMKADQKDDILRKVVDVLGKSD